MPDDNQIDPRLAEIQDHWLPADEANKRMKMVLGHLEAIRTIISNIPSASFVFKVAAMARDDEDHSSAIIYSGTLTGQQTKEDAAIGSVLVSSGSRSSDAMGSFINQIGFLGLVFHMLDDDKVMERLGPVLMPYHIMRSREKDND